MPLEDRPDPLKPALRPMNPDDPAFVIDCVGWHTQRRGNEGLEEVYRTIYGTLIRFLQHHQLLTREILPDGAPVSDATAIRRGDLTEEGFQFIQQNYSRWLDRIDMGADPTDTCYLERALTKIRAGETGK